MKFIRARWEALNVRFDTRALIPFLIGIVNVASTFSRNSQHRDVLKTFRMTLRLQLNFRLKVWVFVTLLEYFDFQHKQRIG